MTKARPVSGGRCRLDIKERLKLHSSVVVIRCFGSCALLVAIIHFILLTTLSKGPRYYLITIAADVLYFILFQNAQR